ncbi:MAG: penicillin acylase family protein [Bacteroidia bacterium]|nr:penicillin acylase family protein [Bacteroidia bacterium]
MTRRLIGGVVLLCTGALVWALSSGWGAVPPVGPLLGPKVGFWQNAEGKLPSVPDRLALKGLRDSVSVQFDARWVPHVFATNDHDLYFTQGYLTAQLRLFQIDFQTRAAGGRLSEVLGERTLEFDKRSRRLGLLYGAENALKAIEQDTVSMRVIEAYTAGINAYLATLSPKDYPVEYKLLDFAPEPWAPLRTALLLKQMALTLSYDGSDFALSQLRSVLGPEVTEALYPNYQAYQDPIIPPDTKWDFSPVPVAPVPDSLNLAAEQSAYVGGGYEIPRRDKGIGSNNWVIGAEKSATGYPILANDPHLTLTLPSIWLEMHLSAPGVNVYGVSLPGAPGIIIGFNQDVAWGVTNVGADVVDWYRIQFTDTLTYAAYTYNGATRPTTQRIESFQVKGVGTVYDTVLYTHHGPLVHLNERTHPQRYQAMRWTAHAGGNELRTFLGLNRARNYDDYLEALRHYDDPAQNFIFADRQKTIALRVNGKFPLKAPGQGKYVMDGTTPASEWQGWIPRDHVPSAKNPARGFLSSANQHSAAPDYPYYLDWDQENWERGARINQRLAQMQRATPDSLRLLQNDNHSLMAEKVLPLLLDSLRREKLSPEHKAWADTLAAWRYTHAPWSTAATVFSLWRTLTYQAIWSDELDPKQLLLPDRETTTALLFTPQAARWVDDVTTPTRESLADLTTATFVQTLDSLERKLGPPGQAWQWAAAKNTTVRYLLPLAPFSRFGRPGVAIGGGVGIVNAAGSSSGPSWRMVVALGAEGPTAYGIYPGGQSGNPGSRFYDNFIDTWTRGELAPLQYSTAPLTEGVLHTVRLAPAQR